MTSVRDFLYGGCAALAIATGASNAVAATAATDLPVYKCKQASGAVAYQDYPCKGGVVVDIKPDVADPAAIARLERAQNEFNRAAAEREAQSLRREALNLRRRELDASRALAEANAQAPGPGYYSGYSGYAPGYVYDYGVPYRVPYVTQHPRATPHDSGDRRRHAPQGRVPAVIRLPRGG